MLMLLEIRQLLGSSHPQASTVGADRGHAAYYQMPNKAMSPSRRVN